MATGIDVLNPSYELDQLQSSRPLATCILHIPLERLYDPFDSHRRCTNYLALYRHKA